MHIIFSRQWQLCLFRTVPDVALSSEATPGLVPALALSVVKICLPWKGICEEGAAADQEEGSFII